jgi:hypothetical protein
VAIEIVSNVDEAVALARRFQSEGRYDWFRGQSQNWLVVPTLARLGAKERKAAISRLVRFLGWAENTPGMAEFRGKENAAVAVAQHYGIATPFIDFTTSPEIAGIFASEPPKQQQMENACIVCLNTADVLGFPWNALKESSYDNMPECIRLDVPNLWRLEAQAGVFLYCPFAGIEQVYGFDRILFPVPQKGLSRRAHQRIYPPRKSSLEHLIDQYFHDERIYVGSEQIKRLFPHIPHFQSEAKPLPIPEVAGWGKREQWLPPQERYAFAGTALALQLEIPDKVETVAYAVRAQLVSALAELKDAKTKLLRFQVDLGEEHTTEHGEAVAATLNRLWDGLRLYPYRVEDIITAIGNASAMHLAAVSGRNDDPRTWPCFMSELVEVEYGFRDGGYSRSYVQESTLKDALRPDILDVLPPEHHQAARNPRALLLRFFAPPLLFEATKFSVMYATEVVPCQLVWRPKDSVCFSPYQLETFGLP